MYNFRKNNINSAENEVQNYTTMFSLNIFPKTFVKLSFFANSRNIIRYADYVKKRA